MTFPCFHSRTLHSYNAVNVGSLVRLMLLHRLPHRRLLHDAHFLARVQLVVAAEVHLYHHRQQSAKPGETEGRRTGPSSRGITYSSKVFQ